MSVGVETEDEGGARKMAVNFPGDESNVEAAALLREHVRESLKIAEQIVNTLRLQISHLEEFDESARWPVAHGIIMTRVADDIQAAASLVLRGYFVQAQTLGASVYELSYTAGFIGKGDKRAAKWLEWSDFDRTPWLRQKMVTAVRRSVYGPDVATDDRARYASLCWGKHGNPRFQKKGGVASSPEAHVINVDPSLGGLAHRFGEIALWLMLEPVITYLASLQALGEMPTEVLKRTDTIVELWEPFDARILPRDSTR